MENQNQLKIVVALHEEDKITNKIWRFVVNLAPSYTKIQLEHDVECLFPHISKKGLKLQLHHYDELAGKIVIDSDVDAVEALIKNHARNKDHSLLFFTQKMSSFHLHLQQLQKLPAQNHQAKNHRWYNYTL